MSTGIATREFGVSQETIDAWAQLSGDFNPLHVDPEFAAGTQFGGTICHGHYTLAIMEQTMHQTLGERWLRGGVLAGIRFKSPVRPGRRYVLKVLDAADTDGWQLEVRDAVDGVLAASGRATAPASSI
jgi:3-hydroxybutyryl-CoA dehydratase